ncbi:MAG: hypothetical protein ACXADS_12675 [Candidatus Thorarchaeota archaeon]
MPEEAELDDKQKKEIQKKLKKEEKEAQKTHKKEAKHEQERAREMGERAVSTKRNGEESEVAPPASHGISWKGVAILTTLLVLLVAVSFMISFIHPFLGGALLTVGGFLLGITRKDIRQVLGLD